MLSNEHLDELIGKLAWLFVLLPGFLFTTVLGLVTELPEFSELQLTCYSLIASMASAIVAWPLAWSMGALSAVVRRAKAVRQVSLTLFLALAFLVAPALGLYFGQAVQNDSFLKLFARFPGITLIDKHSSKRPLVYMLDRNNKGQMKDLAADTRPSLYQRSSSYVQLRLKDGLRYEGWPLYYAHGSGAAEIYLSPACRIDDKDSPTLLPGPGVVVVESELQAVEFLDDEGSGCHQQFKKRLLYPLPWESSHTD